MIRNELRRGGSGSGRLLTEGKADAKVQRGGVGRKWGQEGGGQRRCVRMRLSASRALS